MRLIDNKEILIDKEDDPEAVVDYMLRTNYSEEFCYAVESSPDFVARLARAGFLVMSAKLTLAAELGTGLDEGLEGGENSCYILTPKLHITRDVLFFDKLHVTKTTRRIIRRGIYRLRFNTCYEHVVQRCIEKHGSGWLTTPLCCALEALHTVPRQVGGRLVQAVSFELFRRDGEGGETLAAGEFGTLVGKLYTSYSGYTDEDSAGDVQMALTAAALTAHGAPFWDLGMPLPYKEAMGCSTVDTRSFVQLWRGNQ
jgi:Leu/Phe-tRNA-protein transferase